MSMGTSEGGNNTEVVRVWLLGGFRVSVGSRTIGVDRWRRRKAAALIKVLALTPNHRMHREQVMNLLWPHLTGEAAANNLHRTLYVARRNIESDPLTTSRYLTLNGEQLSLCAERDLWVDVEAFEQAAAAARRSREPAAYRSAIDLYAGELLPEDRYEEWTEERRRRLREMHHLLLLGLARLYEERANHNLAAEVLGQVLVEDPVREEAHMCLMRLHALRGHRGEALRQYERLEEILSRELGAEPGGASHALREEIAAGRFPPPNGQPRVVSEPAPPSEGQRVDSANTSKHNLPVQRTSFVGRERELLEVKRELAMTRLLTLTGTGGTGKTRLALEVARELAPTYPDGAWVVELAGLSEPELVPAVVAGTLGVREQPGRPPVDALLDALGGKEMLVILDNCEHLIEAVARFADELLGACPKLRVLATSREPMRVPGEVVWRLDPLPVPEPTDPALLTEEGLARLAVTRLFLDRAHRRKDDSVFSGRGVQAVASVCRRLEGIPLAIELAAARTATLSVEQIDERLEDSLNLLTTGFRSADPRHRTLRATLDWSHELLSEAERALFRRLSVFAGGFRLEAAEAIGSGEGVGEGEVLNTLSRLVDKSLVTLEEGAHVGTLRYTMLEPVRQYARQKVRESGEEEAVQGRHAGYFLALSEEAEAEMSGPNQEAWVKKLKREHANLRGALAWALDPSDSREPTEHQTELGLRLAGALGRFWGVYSPGEGLGWLEKGLARGEAAPKSHLAKALYEAGWIELFQGDYQRAISLLEEGLALFRELGDKRGVATSLVNLGFAALHLGDQARTTVLR